jgi:transposase
MYKLHTCKQEKYFHEVIRLFYEEGYSKSRICSVLPIDRKTIFRWIAMYNHAPNEIAKPQPETEAPAAPSPNETDARIQELEQHIQELEQKTAELEVQLKFEKLRADLYNKMIDITESKFNIQIRNSAVIL